MHSDFRSSYFGSRLISAIFTPESTDVSIYKASTNPIPTYLRTNSSRLSIFHANYKHFVCKLQPVRTFIYTRFLYFQIHSLPLTWTLPIIVKPFENNFARAYSTGTSRFLTTVTSVQSHFSWLFLSLVCRCVVYQIFSNFENRSTILTQDSLSSWGYVFLGLRA